MGIVEDFMSLLTGVAGDLSVLVGLLRLRGIGGDHPPNPGGVRADPQPPHALVRARPRPWRGKAVGSSLVFKIGMEIEGPIRRWSQRFKFFGKFIELCERFVARFGYYALYILLSIPFMSDTAVLYIFSITNKEGEAMKMKWFAVVNFLAGVTRAIFLVALLYIFNINLFN